MDAFHQSLRFLLHQEPADFVRFALDDPAVRVLSPLASGVAPRPRDADVAYYVERGGAEIVVHFEIHRRHQSEREVAVDVGEAQLRLYRRTQREVVSLVWDLYGSSRDSVVTERRSSFGVRLAALASQIVYVRVNPRGMSWKALLATAPPSFWPLVALCHDGACEEAVRWARDAIAGRTDLTARQQADHLAALWFVAEAEAVPIRVLRAHIAQERLMASTLYQSIVEQGRAQERAETIIEILALRLGRVEPAVATRIRDVSNVAMLRDWFREALCVQDAASARRFVASLGSSAAS